MSLYAKNDTMTSVVSYPRRCSAWGDRRFHGNCDGTLFKDLVLRYRPRRVADPMMGSGTTRDVIEGLARTTGAPALDYWGSDLSADFDLRNGPLPGAFDFIWVHPPYWNIVRYSDDPRDLSAIDDYGEFVDALQVSLARCASALRPGGRLAVLIADVRRRGVYYPLGREVLRMEFLGELASVIVKHQHNCRSDAKTYGHMQEVPIKHEYCCIFRNTGRAGA